MNKSRCSNWAKHPVLLATAFALTACGGGGGGGTTGTVNGTNAPAPSGNVANIVAPANTTTTNIVAVAPNAPTTYSVEELAAYNAFNTARANCGFGYLQQNTALDSAATHHVGWMIYNNTVSHYEVANTVGFTGATIDVRGAYAGYSNGIQFTEVLTGGTNIPKLGFGAKGARGLLAAPYHLMGLMQNNREIGISVRSGGGLTSGADFTAVAALPVTWLVADMASSSGLLPQVQANSEVLTFPCQGTSNAAVRTDTESPNPVPSRANGALAIGQPIYVQAPIGQTLVISSVSMVDASNAAVQLMPTMSSSNDPNFEIQANQAMLIPSNPLSPNTAYTVTINGTANGVAMNKTFTFSTGS